MRAGSKSTVTRVRSGSQSSGSIGRSAPGSGSPVARVDDVHVLGDGAFAHRRREVNVEAEQIARDLLRVRVDLDHERRRRHDVVARAGDREGIEVVELDVAAPPTERVMHEHGVRRARDEGIRRYEAERVPVDLVASRRPTGGCSRRADGTSSVG